jgi:large subunit ribosomal protein L15
MGKTKTSKHRGSRTCGRGHKGGRGKGKRGGHGNAGGHKHHWIYTLKYDRDHFGSKGKGFVRPLSVVAQPLTVNVGELKRVTERLEREGAIAKGAKAIDLGALGFDKLLGSGSPDRAWEITVEFASGSALDKVKTAGGKVTLTGKPKVPKPAAKPAGKPGAAAKPAQAPKPEGKSASKAEGKPAGKPDAKPEGKPSKKPEGKPAEKPKASAEKPADKGTKPKA